MKNVLLLFVVLISVNPMYVIAGDCKTNIYFGNGINTTPAAAIDAAVRIRRAWGPSLQIDYPNHSYEFRVSYNETVGMTGDIAEVFVQKIKESGFTLGSVIGYQLFQALNAGLNLIEIEKHMIDVAQAVIQGGLLLLYVDAYAEAVAETFISQEVALGSHISQYESDLLNGERVIVIAHSQGNLFANGAINVVIQRSDIWANSVRIIGVASPASRVINSNTYATAHDDRVIKALSIAGNVLRSNIDNDPRALIDFRSISNHLFERDYFDLRLRSRANIDSTFFSVIRSLQFPDPENSDTCLKLPACGDSILNHPEQCDDGNLVDGDGCDASCMVEPGGDPMGDADGDGYSELQGDCDDTNSSVFTGAPEICGDGVDQDCNGIDQSCQCRDADRDGFFSAAQCGTAVDCNDSDPNVSPGSPEISSDGIDQNCDGRDSYGDWCNIGTGCPECSNCNCHFFVPREDWPDPNDLGFSNDLSDPAGRTCSYNGQPICSLVSGIGWQCRDNQLDVNRTSAHGLFLP